MVGGKEVGMNFKNNMNIYSSYIRLNITSILVGFLILSGCSPQLSYSSLEDVEDQRIEVNNGDKKAIDVLINIYQNKNQSLEVRLAAIRALSESRDPKVIISIQNSIETADLVNFDLMKESIKALSKLKQSDSKKSFMTSLNSLGNKYRDLDSTIGLAITDNENNPSERIKQLSREYVEAKRNYASINQRISQELGKIDTTIEKVIPILINIAQDKKLSLSIRRNAIDILSKRNSVELIDFFTELIRDNKIQWENISESISNDKLDQGEIALYLLEANSIAKNYEHALLNSVITGLNNYSKSDSIKIPLTILYKDIVLNDNLPSHIRKKGFKGLINFSEEKLILNKPDENMVYLKSLLDLLRDSKNYVYYREILDLLKRNDVYELYKNELREVAFQANKQYIDNKNENLK